MNDDICFVLVETTHSGNIGAAARAMKTMGFKTLRLVKPCKYLTTDSLARASGADDIVKRAEVFNSLEEAIADCSLIYGTSARSRTLEWSTQTLEEAAPEVAARGTSNGARAAVVFGRERSGLSNEELELCHKRLSIPTNPQFSSLNLGSAVQVVAYEIGKALQKQGSPEAFAQSEGAAAHQGREEAAVQDDLPVDSQSMEHFYTHLERVMLASGFLNPENPRLLMRRLRRFFGRSEPRPAEMQILRGILSSCEKSMKGSSEVSPEEATGGASNSAATD